MLTESMVLFGRVAEDNSEIFYSYGLGVGLNSIRFGRLRSAQYPVC